MRTLFGFLLLFCGLSLLVKYSISAEDTESGFIPLFNGKDFDGFDFRFSPPKKKPDMKDDPPPIKADPKDTWSVKDGSIICKGLPIGYFFTKKTFSNYIIRYEWRFPVGSDEKSNSGCLVHMQFPHTTGTWPKSIEAQGRYFNHGKIFTTGLTKEEIPQNDFDQEKCTKALKPMGEWSTTEVTCLADGSLRVKLNGMARCA